MEPPLQLSAAPNNGMHPTANSIAFIENLPVPMLFARRVMPGVGRNRTSHCNNYERGINYDIS